MKMIVIIALVATVVVAKQPPSLPITGRSQMWDDLELKAQIRHKRQSITSWQMRENNVPCRLNDVTRYDALKRRDSDVLADVANQGNCGSCWAVAATHAYIDAKSIYYGEKKQLFSTQYATRCAPAADKNGYGCDGDLPKRALLHFQSTGIALDNCLPYSELVAPRKMSQKFRQMNPLSCFSQCFNEEPVSASQNKLNDYRCYSEADENFIMRALNNGYVVITGIVSNNNEDFRKYRCGVLTTNSEGRITHAVVIVDYGTTNTNLKFWVIKNSWGSKWGECGYFRVRRGGDLRIGTHGNCVCIPIVSSKQPSLPPSDSNACGFASCASEDVTNPDDNDFTMSAATFGIESLVEEQLFDCPSGKPASNASLLEFQDAEAQDIAGTFVDLNITVSLEGCAVAVNRSVELSVVIDPDGNFALTNYTISSSAKLVTASVLALAVLVISCLSISLF